MNVTEGKRVVWTHHEKERLAKYVVTKLLESGIDPDEAVDYEADMMEPLRHAIAQLPEHRQRSIGGPSHVKDWLPDMMVEMVRAWKGQPSKYPPDILSNVAPPPPPPIPPEKYLKVILRHVKNAAFNTEGVEDAVLGVGEQVEALQKQVENLAQQVMLLHNVITTFVTSQPRQKVAVVGFSARQAAGLAHPDFTFEVIDPYHQDPESVAADHIFVLKHVPSTWMQKATRVFGDRMVRVDDPDEMMKVLGKV